MGSEAATMPQSPLFMSTVAVTMHSFVKQRRIKKMLTHSCKACVLMNTLCAQRQQELERQRERVRARKKREKSKPNQYFGHTAYVYVVLLKVTLYASTSTCTTCVLFSLNNSFTEIMKGARWPYKYQLFNTHSFTHRRLIY